MKKNIELRRTAAKRRLEMQLSSGKKPLKGDDKITVALTEDNKKRIAKEISSLSNN